MYESGSRFDKIRKALRIDRTIRFVWTNVPGLTVAGGIVLSVLAVLPLVNLWLMKLIIDKVVLSLSADSNVPFADIAFLVFLAGLTVLLTLFFQHISVYIRNSQSMIISDRVFAALHEKSIRVDQRYYEQSTYFNTLHRAQQEGPYRPARIVNGVTLVFQNAFSLIAVAGLLFTLHWSIPLLVIVCVLPGIAVRVKFSSTLYQWKKLNTETERETDYLNWLITGRDHAKEIRLFNTGHFFTDRFNRLKTRLRVEKLAHERRKAIAGYCSEAFTVFAMFLSFGYMAFKTVSGDITPGDLVMFYQAFQKGLLFLKELLKGGADIYEDNLFLSDYYAFLDIEESVTSPETPELLPDLANAEVSFNNVSFAYHPSREPVLKDISFKINPGEVVALTGENGAGKTTLVKLLCRLYDPDNGSVSIGGVNIKKFSPEHLRQALSVVFQDYAQYNFSAGMNIQLGDIHRDYDINTIKTAAEMSGAASYISGLPEGYDAILGTLFKDGYEPSAGQWQKIAIARAFYRDSGLLVFDEPASSLDVQSEYEVFKQIKKLLNGRSAVLISHRFSTIRMADRIIVLDNGVIGEEGTHKELLQKKGLYYTWFQKQADNFIQGSI